MTKILLAGVNGFVGHHVARALQAKGVKIIGVSNQPVLNPDLKSVVSQYYGLDLMSTDEVSTIKLRGVDVIINLAGFAKISGSAGQGELYNRVNVGVHVALYEECLRQGVSPRIIAVSTGAVYDPSQPMPITEESELIEDDKTNEYVISKKLTEQAVLEFADRGLHCIIARPFNHTGPGQLPGFLLPDLAEQIRRAAGTGKSLMVGNLETKRDFTDVRDVAEAYVSLALCDKSKLKHNIYNICSGKSIAGKDILAMLGEALGIDNLQTEIDPAKLRANDVMDIYGSRERLSEATGWEPTIPIEQTIRDFIGSNN